MADLQFDEFPGNELSDIWTVQAGMVAEYFVAGGQLNIDVPGPTGAARRFQQFPDVNVPFDVMARFTFPGRNNVDVGNGTWRGEYLEFNGGNNGVDVGMEWARWDGTVPFGLYIYWDSYNFLDGAEWHDGYIDIGDLVDLDFVTAYVRMKSPGSGQIIRLFSALQEPFVESDWTEITTGQILSNVPDVDPPYPWLSLYGGVQTNTTPGSIQVDYFRSWPRSGLKTDQLADLDDIFYNLAEFAEKVVYIPRGGSAAEIKAVILDQDGSLSEGYALADTLNIRVRSSDVYQPGRDALILAGEQWNVLRNVGGGPSIGEWELEISRADKRVL